MAFVGKRNTLAGGAFINQGPQTVERSTLRRLLAGVRSDAALATWTTDNTRTARGYLPSPQNFRIQANPIEPPPLPSLRGGSRITTALPSAGEGN
jgi:hypothetical protein